VIAHSIAAENRLAFATCMFIGSTLGRIHYSPESGTALLVNSNIAILTEVIIACKDISSKVLLNSAMLKRYCQWCGGGGGGGLTHLRVLLCAE
jgi:hypothetical protein